MNSRRRAREKNPAAQSTSKRRYFLISLLTLSVMGVSLYFTWTPINGQGRFFGRTPFDGERSYRALIQICEMGPRPSGSVAMETQRKFLADQFAQLGAKVSFQTWDERHPVDGSAVPMRNLIAEWHPDRPERILLCAHYDTRPYPDRDRRRPRGVFVGANDGASGAALLYEMGHHMMSLKGICGVDFVLFDGEEFIFDDDRDGDRYFIGSRRFSEAYVAQPPEYRYRWGVLVDMVGDADLQIYHEKNSLKYARPLVIDIWKVAASLKIDEFRGRSRHEIRDDHLKLNEIAKIPSCDIIDFDYPRPSAFGSYWHTEQDTPDKCSAESLQKVGAVLLTWLQQEIQKPR